MRIEAANSISVRLMSFKYPPENVNTHELVIRGKEIDVF
jgi:hypothetical protein